MALGVLVESVWFCGGNIARDLPDAFAAFAVNKSWAWGNRQVQATLRKGSTFH